MKPYYVIGHKNPDCDAVVSSIAYAQLKNKLGIPAKAYALSDPNPETKYLLQKFSFPLPPIVHSAKCTLADIEKDEAVLVSPGTTIKDALDLVITHKNKGVFITDEDKHLLGLVSVSDLTQFWKKDEKEMADLMRTVSIANILHVLKGKAWYETDFQPSGQIHIVPSTSDDPSLIKDSIIILRNSPELQRFSIINHAAVIIVCGEDWIDNVTLEMAQKEGVSIMHSSLSVLECSRLIFECPDVSQVATRQVICFYENETVEEVSDRLAKTRFRTYPVLNEDKQVVAAISRYHLFHYEKKRFILMDHNEAAQSVNDLSAGIVSEIVDHHRMGGITTINPIAITSRPVGSTCTIVASLYEQNNVELDQRTAGLLLGGLVNDTLCLRSPTTTQEDRDLAGKLEGISGVSKEDLNVEMINAADSILKKTDLELLYDDFKEFHIHDIKVGIGQSPCKDSADFFKIRDHFYEYLQEQVIQQHFDLILIMFTDPKGSGSYFLYTGKKSSAVEDGFHDILREDGFAPGIISRKKQVLPVIIEMLSRA